jgi:hypothetical protein
MSGKLYLIIQSVLSQLLLIRVGLYKEKMYWKEFISGGSFLGGRISYIYMRIS